MADKSNFTTKDGDTWTDEGAYWQNGPYFLERDGADIILLTDSCGSHNVLFRVPVAALRAHLEKVGLMVGHYDSALRTRIELQDNIKALGSAMLEAMGHLERKAGPVSVAEKLCYRVLSQALQKLDAP